MALIHCKECGAEISSLATACPRCGCPVSGTDAKKNAQPPQEKKKASDRKMVLLAVLAVMFVAAIGLLFWYLVDTDHIFLSKDSKMEYYLRNLDDDSSVARTVDLFNAKYAGTEDEAKGLALLAETWAGSFGDNTYTMEKKAEILSGLQVEDEGVDNLNRALEFIVEKVVSTYDICDNPDAYIGSRVTTFGYIDKVDADRQSIILNAGTFSSVRLEAFYNSFYYDGFDWSANREYGSSIVLTYGDVVQYSNSANAYLSMRLCIPLREYDNLWEEAFAVCSFMDRIGEIEG